MQVLGEMGRRFAQIKTDKAEVRSQRSKGGLFTTKGTKKHEGEENAQSLEHA